MKNKEIALRVGTTEQVVKNYLRKVYDKLGVADRLELALYCLNNRVVDGVPKQGMAVPVNTNGKWQLPQRLQALPAASNRPKASTLLSFCNLDFRPRRL